MKKRFFGLVIITLLSAFAFEITFTSAQGLSQENVIGFTGQDYFESVDLVLFPARAYSPETGRFLQRDPSGYADGVNLYEYVSGNALGNVDSLGLESVEVHGKQVELTENEYKFLGWYQDDLRDKELNPTGGHYSTGGIDPIGDFINWLFDDSWIEEQAIKDILEGAYEREHGIWEGGAKSDLFELQFTGGLFTRLPGAFAREAFARELGSTLQGAKGIRGRSIPRASPASSRQQVQISKSIHDPSRGFRRGMIDAPGPGPKPNAAPIIKVVEPKAFLKKFKKRSRDIQKAIAKLEKGNPGKAKAYFAPKGAKHEDIQLVTRISKGDRLIFRLKNGRIVDGKFEYTGDPAAARRAISIELVDFIQSSKHIPGKAGGRHLG